MPDFKLDGEVLLCSRTEHHQFVVMPNGLFLSSEDDRLKLYDSATYKMVRDVLYPKRTAMRPEEVGLSPDGRLVAFAGDAWCHVFDTTTGQLLPRFEGPGGVARHAPRFTADGRFLLLWYSGYDEKTRTRQVTLRAYDTKSGEDKGRLPGLPDGVLDYVEGPSGKHAVILLKEKTLGLWDIAGRREYAKLAEGVESCKVAFSPDESEVAIAQSNDDPRAEYRIRIWKTDKGTLEHELQPDTGRSVHDLEPEGYEAVEGLQWTPDARFVFAATRTSNPLNTVRIWGGRSGRLRARLCTDLGPPLNGVAMLPDGCHLAVSGSGVSGSGVSGIVMQSWDFEGALKQIRAFEDSLAGPKAGK